MGTEYKVMENVLKIKIDGELDHHVADGLRESVDRTFEEEKMKHIIFDFSQISLMDSSGIGFIMGRYKKVSEKGGKVCLIGTNPYVTRLLEMAGIFSIIKKCKNVEEAMPIIRGEVNL